MVGLGRSQFHRSVCPDQGRMDRTTQKRKILQCPLRMDAVQRFFRQHHLTEEVLFLSVRITHDSDPFLAGV